MFRLLFITALSFAFCCPAQTVNTQVLAWDWDAYGQTDVPPGLTNVVAIAAGYADTKVLKSDGTAAAWGSYWDNHGNWIPTTVPSYVSNVVMMASGDSHAVGLKADGTVLAWGDNSVGQLNVPAGLGNVIAVACGGWHSLALKTDGTLVGWGTAIPPGLSNVVAVAGGEYSCIAARADGTVLTWDTGGGIGTVPVGLTNVVAVASGFYHNLVLNADGTITAWGAGTTNSGVWPDYGQSVIPDGLSNVVAISAGGYHSMALRADGTVFAWGEEGNVPGLTNISAIAAGGHHCVALLGGGPPIFTLKPVNRTVAAGSTVNVRAAADGSFPLAYFWRFGGLDLPSGQVLTITNVQLNQSGDYSVTISNSFGSISSDMLLNVVPLLITAQPQGLTAAGGDTVSFSVTVAGLGLTYQWLFNGSNLAGQTSSTLTLTNLQLNQAGNYSVVVSNSYGAVTSTPAALTVVPFFITVQPQSKTVYSGTNVVLSGAAQGQGPFAWQWLFNGATLPGATDSSLTLSNVQTSQSGSYTLQISDAFGTLVTSNAQLVVQVSLPLLVSQSGSRSVFLNASVTLSVSATGSLPLSYQWHFNGADIPGATNPSLVISSMQAANAGVYDALITNPVGSTNTTNIVLNLIQVFCWGNNTYGQTNVPASLGWVTAVAAGGFHNLALRADGTVIAWGAGSNVTVTPNLGQSRVPAGATNVMAIAAGGYHSLALQTNGAILAWGDNTYHQTNVPAWLTNAVAVAAGSFHSLALRADGTVVVWGRNTETQTNVPPGLSNIVSVAAGGFHNLALRSNGTVMAWGNNSFLQTNVPASLSNVIAVAAGQGFSLALKGDGSVAAWGNMESPPPAGLSNVVAIAAGGPVNPGPYFLGQGLVLRKDGSLTAWGYSNNGQGTVPSGINDTVAIGAGGSHNVALLGDGRPWIVRQPANQTVYSAGIATFLVAAVSQFPLTYQWQFNGTNIEGATNAVLMLTNVALSAQGLYHVLVSNALGSVASADASLVVLRSVPQFAPLTLPNSSGATLTLINLSGHGPIVIYSSTDLRGWQPLLTNPPVLGAFQFLDSSARNFSERFYRAVEQ
jgi:alpha-tubulin suppressor-like RCC1 family protein